MFLMNAKIYFQQKTHAAINTAIAVNAARDVKVIANIGENVVYVFASIMSDKSASIIVGFVKFLLRCSLEIFPVSKAILCQRIFSSPRNGTTAVVTQCSKGKHENETKHKRTNSKHW